MPFCNRQRQSFRTYCAPVQQIEIELSAILCSSAADRQIDRERERERERELSCILCPSAEDRERAFGHTVPLYSRQRQTFRAYCALVQQIEIDLSGILCPSAAVEQIAVCLTTLVCGPDEANQLYEVSAALSPLLFLYIICLSRFSQLYITVIMRGRRVIWIYGSLIWPKTLMELIFNSYGGFRRNPEGPVSQIHSPHLHVGASGTFSDLLMSVQILKREWSAESNGKLPQLLIPSKTATLVPLRQKTCLWAELQPWCLNLQ